MFGKLKEKLAGGASRLNGKTDLLEAICAICARVGSADGDYSEAEAETALGKLLEHDTISVAFSSSQIEQTFNKMAKLARGGMSGRIQLKREIDEAKAKNTRDDLEMALMIGIDVAAADGDIGDKEKTVLIDIGKVLGFDAASYLA